MESETPEPITDVEFNLAMMLVKGRFPNTAFVIEKYLQQREHKAWDSGQESVLLYPKDKRPTFEQWQASKGEK